MRLTIDNADGLGAVDYSATLATSDAGTVSGSGSGSGFGLKIVRTLNAPTTVEATLCLEGSGLAPPVRKGRIVVASDTGLLLFTGYLTTEPVPVYAGVASAGPVYRLALRAVSDEWLLDRATGQSSAANTGVTAGLGAASGVVLGSLVGRLGVAGVSSGNFAGGRAIGVFAAPTAGSWSAAAGSLAAAAYGSYRVLDGAVTLVNAGATTHALSEGAGSLNVSALKTSRVRELANDVTVSGAMEPAAYWTELFAGDGTTAAFALAGEPDAVNTGHATLVDDGFMASELNTNTWVLTDPGAHVALSGGALGGGGLLLDGGNGLDGQTTLAGVNPVEMGGTLLLELDSVTLSGASAGVVGGFYEGSIAQANCFAGWNVRQAGGNTVVTPLVDGAEVGTTFPMVEGHLYTLRLRLHCPEMLRLRQAYYAMSENAGGVGGFSAVQFGGGLVEAAISVVFEIRDLGLSSNTYTTVLYDGEMASTPASCTLVAANAVQLFGSIGALKLLRTGSGWVSASDPATGMVGTRLVGGANDGVDCRLTGAASTAAGPAGEGTLTFYPGRIPGAGSTVTVRYRGRQRAVARMANVASVAAEVAGGAPGTSRWIGEVLKPAARSTEDCEAAAAAILSFAGDRSAAVAGSYTMTNPASDVWPGDALAFTESYGPSFSALVRTVTVEAGGAAPETLRYTCAFANDWAEGLGLTLSEAIAADAVLPATAIDSTVTETMRVLGNLPNLQAPGTSGSGASLALQVDAGQDAPSGGGFEVRRRDGGFGAGAGGFTASDLVLRSPVRGFQIPLAAVGEQFFVRMYDGSTPPLYSRCSSAIVSHLPVG